MNFGSTNATSFTVNSGTQITATAPAGAGTVDITVTTPAGGTSATEHADQFTYNPPPDRHEREPRTTGRRPAGPRSRSPAPGFTGATGGRLRRPRRRRSFTVDSATQITATAPAGSGTVDVTVTTPAGGTSAHEQRRSVHLQRRTDGDRREPDNGPAGRRDHRRHHRDAASRGATAVNFGATNATSFTVNSATQITATAPAGRGTVDITVTTPAGGTSGTSNADQFTYNARARPSRA